MSDVRSRAAFNFEMRRFRPRRAEYVKFDAQRPIVHAGQTHGINRPAGLEAERQRMRRAGFTVRFVAPDFHGHEDPAVLDITFNHRFRTGRHGESVFRQPGLQCLCIVRRDRDGFKNADNFPVENRDVLSRRTRTPSLSFLRRRAQGVTAPRAQRVNLKRKRLQMRSIQIAPRATANK